MLGRASAGARPGPGTVSGDVSYRPVRAIGLLLVFEVAGLVGLGLYEISRIPWRRLLAAVREASGPEVVEALTAGVIEALAILFFAPAAVLALLSALSFLLLRRRGWLLAAISQGLTLAVSLFLYSEYQPVYVYPIMVYAILLVLYLNSHDVRVVFHPGSGPANRGPEATPERDPRDAA